MTREFHVSRLARERYRFDESLFQLSGNVILANFHAARLFAQRINRTRDLARFPEQAIRAGQLNAMGLIDEILHYVVELYRQQKNPTVMSQALAWLEQRLGREAVEKTLRRFSDEFPPLVVYRRKIDLDAYLAGESDGVPHRNIALEELLLLWLANANPAFAPFLELFDDERLERETAYSQIIAELHTFFETQPRFGPDHQNLVDMLRSPAIAVPYSLPGQLEYIRTRWGALLGRYIFRMLGSLDLIREEERPIFPGPGPIRVYKYTGLELETERFSPDRDWMPRLVLIAKNTYVWLDQLSRKYGRPIQRLDQIPDEELATLAEWGFTGLWLIGLWERSWASQRIKQLCGNPEAAASAYALYDYQIAAALGGEQALLDLRHRAWRHGIRLASDMVPNHMAIDSKWVIEHPDWFIGQDYSPFPNYTFNGPDLSQDERVGIFIEDHYYDRTDAAVVFKRLDRWTGAVRYIYHGNDGTGMPWNDTAQLNYLKPEVREAVIRVILDVARRFPIIRFDAAMTLTKRHYQRLWFPEPGTGGDIPSRSDHAMTRAEFDAAMPNEFWREVVDRVAQEMPDTLLLAEAFWLMEGYFVRTLGMHRVYNSAFMNMLRDEENAKYRSVIKNTLEFDPEILKRFVNFMNNPDERTAVDQFGKDDKYFGVCTMMVTMPGLPMFGHGQIEGFAEKYGMEYRRAYWDEKPDEWLIERHRREIFPLLHRRHLFSEVRYFRLYDFFSLDGSVNEDVFAYSNRCGDERALIIYNNRFAEARGWIRTSVAYSVKSGHGDERHLVQDTLGEGLGLHHAPGWFSIFRDHVSGLEYIRSNQELCSQGLYVELGAYKRHVFLDWRQVQDDAAGHYARLTSYLAGRGVPDIAAAMRELLLQPVLLAFEALLDTYLLRRWCLDYSAADELAWWETLWERLRVLVQTIKTHTGGLADTHAILAGLRCEIEAAWQLLCQPLQEVQQGFYCACASDDPLTRATLYGWLIVHRLAQVVDGANYATLSRSWMDEWGLSRRLVEALGRILEVDSASAERTVLGVKWLVSHSDGWIALISSTASVARASGEDVPTVFNLRARHGFRTLFADSDVQQFLGVNRYQGVLWFHQESFEQLLWWLRLIIQIGLRCDLSIPSDMVASVLEHVETILRSWEEQARRCGYQVEPFLDALETGSVVQTAGQDRRPSGDRPQVDIG
ncbi:MAG: alpha-amylase family glycosyl hydrolase [Anaerolineae bacterium]|nr:alpha-amylase family glycosyl hydrolase [Anaerolineae bacterium]